MANPGTRDDVVILNKTFTERSDGLSYFK